jgi:erythronate-4-phosphate dehydrogenase
MRRIRIIADDKIPFLKGVLEEVADIVYRPGSSIDENDVRNADALLVRTRTHCNESLLNGSAVKFIATATIGYDHIDTVFCKAKNIFWTNSPGCNSSSVEQYLVSSILNLAKSGNFTLKGKCIGIIGVGNVGSKVARASQAIGLKVMLNDPPRALTEGLDGFESLEKIQKEADIISFHVPLNFEGPFKTAGMADRNFFEKISKKVILINSSRGEVIKEDDLYRSLKSSLFSGVVLDVWNNEPNINKDLLHELAIATPHIAGYSTDGKANGTMMSIQALSRFFNLGLDNWLPKNVPLPENNEIIVDCTGKTEIEILHEVYMHTYDIREDDKSLRADVDGFESQRGRYRLRREPSVYNVKLINNSLPEVEQSLVGLGFTLIAPNCFCEI